MGLVGKTGRQEKGCVSDLARVPTAGVGDRSQQMDRLSPMVEDILSSLWSFRSNPQQPGLGQQPRTSRPYLLRKQYFPVSDSEEDCPGGAAWTEPLNILYAKVQSKQGPLGPTPVPDSSPVPLVRKALPLLAL